MNCDELEGVDTPQQIKSDLEVELEKVKAEKETLRLELDSLKQTYREVEADFPTYSGLVMENCRLKNKIIELETLAEFRAWKETELIESQEKTEAEKDAAVSKLIEFKSHGFYEVCDLHEKVRSQREQIIKVEQEKEELSSGLKEAQLKLKMMEEKKDQVVEKYGGRNVELYEENVEFYANIKELKKHLADLEELNKKLNKEKAKQLTKVQEEEEKVKALEISLQDRENEKTFYRENSEEAVSQVMKLIEMNTAQEEKIEGLKLELNGLEIELQQKTAEVDDFKAQIRQLMYEKKERSSAAQNRVGEGLFQGQNKSRSIKRKVAEGFEEEHKGTGSKVRK